jgi:hypothetical protein
MMGFGKGSGAAAIRRSLSVHHACSGHHLRAPLCDGSMVARSLLGERTLWRGASRAMPPMLVASAPLGRWCYLSLAYTRIAAG